jgi:ureidoacrylate peracid hydrolase
MADPRSRVVAVDAKPEPIPIDLSKTAIMVVDMQNDFGAPGGMFDRAGIDITPIRRVVEPTLRVLTAARQVGLPIVYLKQEHRPDLSDAGDAGSPHRIKHRPLSLGEPVRAPDGTEGRILVKDTWNTAILRELTPRDGDVVVSKHRYSGFYETALDERLRDLGVGYLVFAGATTSVCVESTLRDAMYRDYRCIVLEDCTAEPIGCELPRSNHEASLLTIQLLFGWVSNSDQFVTALSR